MLPPRVYLYETPETKAHWLEMNAQENLRREPGFWAALTIGAGTMIGAGIFLLSGIAICLAGPAAIFSYIAAGVVCIITAANAAELATGMPTSGVDYFFVPVRWGRPLALFLELASG